MRTTIFYRGRSASARLAYSIFPSLSPPFPRDMHPEMMKLGA
jgi:hypothetical protein